MKLLILSCLLIGCNVESMTDNSIQYFCGWVSQGQIILPETEECLFIDPGKDLAIMPAGTSECEAESFSGVWQSMSRVELFVRVGKEKQNFTAIEVKCPI